MTEQKKDKTRQQIHKIFIQQEVIVDNQIAPTYQQNNLFMTMKTLVDLEIYFHLEKIKGTIKL